MSKSNIRQKRLVGKDSPLSKRPKLDLTVKSSNDSKDNSKELSNGYYETINEKVNTANTKNNFEKGNFATTSDWDEDFSGDMLEKVCLIADLSQAIVNNQPVPKEIEKEKIDLEIFDGNKLTPLPIFDGPTNGKINGDLEKLKQELERLQEKFNTKEGEVHILRSQLKQNEDAKQAVVLQNIKIMEDLQKKYIDKINSVEKELESTKTKLQFRDMEYKTLSERCRQLEYNISKNKSGDIPSSQMEISKMHTTFTHSTHQKSQMIDNDNNPVVLDNNAESSVCFEFSTKLNHHEGKYLSKIICPEFFKYIQEPNIVPFYTFRNGINCHTTIIDNFDKREKYKWTNLPKQNFFIKELYDSITNLFSYENFNLKGVKDILEDILETSVKILIHQKEIFIFLEKLQSDYNEFDDSDQSLLENEEEVKVVNVKHLLDGMKLKEEECGIEGRRSLALIYSLMISSQVAFDMVKCNVEFVTLLKDLAIGIGNLRRPLRYTGILLGIAFVLQKILSEKDLDKEIVGIVNEIVEEIIFARPKLDVLMEVVNVLAAGNHHQEFLVSLCRKASVESCALYMDSKLKQAMFFTKNSCPLKLLCMQIMGLACLSSSKAVLCEITSCVIKWLNNSLNTSKCNTIKWLPINSFITQEERCFDVTECLLYLLTLCLRDYNNISLPQNMGEGVFLKNELDKKKCHLMMIIGHGAVLLKRMLKTDPRQLYYNSHSLRFAFLLKALLPNKTELCHKNQMSHMSSVQMEAIFWITDLLESDLRNQEFCLKQNTCTLPDVEIFNALKVNDESKIY